MDNNIISKYSNFVNVPADALMKWHTYGELLRKWQKAINLVSPDTLNNMEERHFIDSAQLISYIPDIHMNCADLGSGAGFPGMVLATMGMTHIHLIESDSRKVAFLQNVSRETFSSITLHNCRIEDFKIGGIDLVTARALAPLEILLGHMWRISPQGMGLFLKGAQFQKEIEIAQEKWNFTLEIHVSLTHPDARILKIKNLSQK